MAKEKPAKKAEGLEYTIGPYEPGDEKEILRLFKKVFNIDRSLEHWNWKFLDNPMGTHIYLAKLPSGRVISQFAGIPVKLKWGEKTCVFSQILDSMTDTEYRKGLKKPGVFAGTCYKFVDYYGRPDREIIMYGLPNPEAYRLGRRLLGYTHLSDVYNLSKDLKDLAPQEEIPGIQVEMKERFSDDLDDLWDWSKKDYSLAIIRDFTYLNWRYTLCPEVTYYIAEARRESDGKLLGVGVLRSDFVGQNVAVIVDLLLPREQEDAGRAIARHCESLAQKGGVEKIQCLVPGYRWEHGLFTRMGYTPEKTQFVLVGRTYSSELPLDWVKKNWYYTLGDFDIV